MEYAGFWKRVLAYIIDAILLFVATAPIAFLLGEPILNTTEGAGFRTADIINTVIGVAFFVGFESSSFQATPGKMALGLIVTDSNGGRITPLRALGRYAAKILSAVILLIGFIMVAFTERKQGLHDLIANTLVIEADPGTGGVSPSVFE